MYKTNNRQSRCIGYNIHNIKKNLIKKLLSLLLDFVVSICAY